MTDLELQLKNYRLTTAQIFYFLPDHPAVLQEFVWQQLDLAPRFPALHGFIAFWREKLDGKLHSVKVAHADLIKPAEFRLYDDPLVIH